MRSQDKMKGFPKNLLSTAVIMAMAGTPSIYAATITDTQTSSQLLTGTVDLTVTETGVISVVQTSTKSGVDILGDYSANLLNNGTISAEVASDTATQSAYGIYVDEAFTGSLINNGIINSSASSDTSQQMYSYGISIDNDDITGGFISNTGEINVNVQGGIQSKVYGIKTDDFSNATFLNSGSINLTGTGQSGDIFAYGFFVEDIETDSSFSAGDIGIDIDVDNTHAANAVGLELDEIEGTLNLDGNIEIDAEAINGQSSIELLYSEYITGIVTHSGSSILNAYSQNRASIKGFSVQSGIEDNGTIVNSGSLNLTAESTDGSAEIEIFDIDSIFSSDSPLLSNTGTTIASATGDEAIVYGFSIHDDANNTLFSNSGTINLTATSDNGTAEAALYNSNDELAGDLSNSGNVIVNAITLENNTASAYGVSLDSLSGSISNSGNMTISAQSEEGLTYSRGFAVGEITGTLTNDGEVTLSSESTDWLAYTYGFSGDDLSGSLINNGNVTLTNTSTNDAFYAYGVSLDSIYGELYNNGTIALQLTSTESSGRSYAYGLLLDELDTGRVENNGTLSLQANVTDQLSLYGFNLSSLLDAELSSDGNINITASADDVTAYGILTGDIDSDSTLSFNDINLAVTGESGTLAYGVYTEAMEGKLYAEGNLSVTGTGNNGSVYLYGMQIDGEVSGEIFHSGNTTVSGQGDQQQNTSYGIRTNNLNGSLIQSGNLSVSAQASDAAAYAYGIRTSDINGTLSHTGDLFVSSQSEADSVQAYGMRLGDIAGPLNNSGTITVELESGDEDGSSLGYGIHAGNLESGSIFTNDGSINVHANITDNALIYGINVDDISNSDFSSTGYITVTASADELQAFGIYGGDIDASSTLTLANITVTAEAISDASASGINFNSLLGNLTLNGDLNITNNSTDIGSNTYGVYIDGNVDGDLINNGNITVSANAGDSYALYLGSGTGSITNTTNALIDGSIFSGGSISITNQGTINLKTTDEIQINGDFTQTDSGILQLGIDGNTASQITINGSATFADNSNLSINTSAYSNINVGDIFNDVISAGTLSASNLSVTDESYLLDYEASIDNNTVDITVTVGNSFSDIATEKNLTAASNAAQYWDTALSDGANTNEIHEILTTFKGMSSSTELATALTETLPLGAQSVSQTIDNVGTTFSKIVNYHVNKNTHDNNLPLGKQTIDHTYWVKHIATTTSQGNSNGINGFEADSSGIAAGIDTETRSYGRVGASFFYNLSDIEVNDANQTNELKSYAVMAYGANSFPESFLNGPLQLNWQAGMAYHVNHAQRHIGFMNSTADAEYDSWSSQLSATISRGYAMSEDVRVTPRFTSLYQYQHNDSYSENGAGALSLNVDSRTNDRFMIGMGLDVDYKLSNKWQLQVNLDINHNLLDSESLITSNYAGDTANDFVTETIAPADTLFAGELALTYQQSDITLFELIYNTESGSGFDAQSLSAKFQRAF